MWKKLIPLVFALLPVCESADASQTCYVNEPYWSGSSGICNGVDGVARCEAYCNEKFGNENVQSDCVDVSDDFKQCQCGLKCCKQGCWGDPHCWTCDNTKFGYQGLDEHYLMKPCQKYAELPNFEIRQTNRLWGSAPGPFSSLDTSTLIVPEWNVVVKVTVPQPSIRNVLVKINGVQIRDFPYRWEEKEDYLLNSIDITFDNKQLIIATSFGVKITIRTPLQFDSPYAYSDLTIETPRHPDLKGKMCGLIGRWNDDAFDDSIDANGKKQTLDSEFSCEFGNSWIVPGKRSAASCSQLQKKRLRRILQNQALKLDDGTKQFIQTLCNETLNVIQNCIKKLGVPAPSVKDCVTDLSAISTDSERIDYSIAMMDNFSAMCKDDVKSMPRSRKMVRKAMADPVDHGRQ